jgi:AcrR family transcriptional regulator
MQKPTSGKINTKERLIQAAIDVMAQAGIGGATTKEIAKVAGMSEVTLFRHFQNKEQLLRSVAQYMTRKQVEALSRTEECTGDLRTDLLHYARIYDERLEEYQALIRIFIGEAERYPQEAQSFLQEGVIPLRNSLIAYLDRHKNQGNLSLELDVALAVDLFTGMILVGALRRHIPLTRHYSRDRYVESCIDLFIQGLNPQQSLKESLKESFKESLKEFPQESPINLFDPPEVNNVSN